MFYAYCDSNGIIEIDDRQRPRPWDAIHIIQHRDIDQLREAIEVLAVHGYDRVSRIVPGYPTAEMMGQTKEQALRDFRAMLERRLN